MLWSGFNETAKKVCHLNSLCYFRHRAVIVLIKTVAENESMSAESVLFVLAAKASKETAQELLSCFATNFSYCLNVTEMSRKAMAALGVVGKGEEGLILP